MRKFILLPVLSAVLLFSFGKGLSAIGFSGGGDIAPQSNLNVVELYTSQSCSSCPPADRLLNTVANDANIIALGFHVTYWDHLHWKDTLSREFATDRQRATARHRNTRRVYTPQMIVNGKDEFVGSSKTKLASALAKPHETTPINVQYNGKNASVEFTLPNIERSTYTLWIAGIQNSHTQSIPSGENRGRTVEYKNAVLDFKSGGSWNGSTDSRTINISPQAAIDRYVVYAQENGYGQILAAGISN